MPWTWATPRRGASTDSTRSGTVAWPKLRELRAAPAFWGMRYDCDDPDGSMLAGCQDLLDFTHTARAPGPSDALRTWSGLPSAQTLREASCPKNPARKPLA